MGAVTVTTASTVNATMFGGVTCEVIQGSPYVKPSADLSALLAVGDWIRLCDEENGLVSDRLWGTMARVTLGVVFSTNPGANVWLLRLTLIH